VRVSADFFSVLDIHPVIGRGFTQEEDSPSGGRVVILTDGLWRRRFGANPELLGKAVAINAKDYTVVGIMPPAFRYETVLTCWSQCKPRQPRRRTQLHGAGASQAGRDTGTGCRGYGMQSSTGSRTLIQKWSGARSKAFESRPISKVLPRTRGRCC
jgi:hypothetical protein